MENKDFFKKHGYVKVKNFISSDRASMLASYTLFRMQIQKEKITGDQQVPGTFAKFSDTCMEHLMVWKRDLMIENTGLTVVPTYTYFRVYKNGDVLKKHKDRPSCEISVTINLGSSDQWPIHVGESGPINLDPGDAVIYRGCDLEHWREGFEGTWCSQVFMHYVDVNGPYLDFYMDKREDIYKMAKEYGLTKK